jgi:hypothetical protein
VIRPAAAFLKPHLSNIRSSERRIHLPEPVYSAPFDFQIGGRPEVLQLDETAIPEFSHLPDYWLHVDLAGLGFKAAGMVRNQTTLIRSQLRSIWPSRSPSML